MRSLFGSEIDVDRPIGEAQRTRCEEASVAILLATFNGAEFLAEQLASVERQTHGNWRVFASDDGSTDDTLEILAVFRDRWGADRIRIVNGPRRGHAANFLSLARDREINVDYYAFCDQDDVWLEDKLERAIHSLAHLGEEMPVLYGSRTQIVDKHNNVIGLSPFFCRAPGLRNALVQSIAGGNTLLFNNAARDCLTLIPPEQFVTTHDWAVYLMVSASGGTVVYDPFPSVRYRQHGGNIIGSNISLMDRFVRLVWIFRGRYAIHCENNLAVLKYATSILSDQNRDVVENFRMMRSPRLLSRARALGRSGVYRQTALDTIGLWLAVLFNKI